MTLANDSTSPEKKSHIAGEKSHTAGEISHPTSSTVYHFTEIQRNTRAFSVEKCGFGQLFLLDNNGEPECHKQ